MIIKHSTWFQPRETDWKMHCVPVVETTCYVQQKKIKNLVNVKIHLQISFFHQHKENN